MWDKVFAALNLKTELAVIQGKWNSDFCIKWSKWRNNKGIVACGNERTVNMVSKMVEEIVINGQSFRAWPPKEFEYLTTLILPKGTEVFKEPWALFMGQNFLQGKHGRSKIENLTNGVRKLQVEVDYDLAVKIRKLGERGALGYFTVTVHVSRQYEQSVLDTVLQ